VSPTLSGCDVAHLRLADTECLGDGFLLHARST
jgi:hypothetical protein